MHMPELVKEALHKAADEAPHVLELLELVHKVLPDIKLLAEDFKGDKPPSLTVLWPDVKKLLDDAMEEETK